MAKVLDSSGSPLRRIAKRRGRRPQNTEDWTEIFLAAVRSGLHVRGAAATAHIHETLPYKRRKTDDAFRQAWDEATEIGTCELEREAFRRAYHGTLKPVYYQGVECGYVREYSDILLIFLLKARDPEYR
jgi:hypothetical protein